MDALEFTLSNVTEESNDILEGSSNATSSFSNFTTQGPRLEQKLTPDGTTVPRATLPISIEKLCPLDCGPGGGCSLGVGDEQPKCLCPLGKGGKGCEEGKCFYICLFLFSALTYRRSVRPKTRIEGNYVNSSL